MSFQHNASGGSAGDGADTNIASQDNNSRHTQADQVLSQHISSAAIVKIPPFWKQNPKLWFVQVEAVFKVNRITRGETKFDHILCNLDPETLEFVSDIIMASSFDGCKYEAIKNKLISAFTISDEKKLRMLLSGHAIGDQKPSHYLQFMRNAGVGQVSDSILKSLFLEQMPENVRIILIGNKGTLEDIADQADKIMEQIVPSVSVITNNVPSLNAILDKIDALEKRFENIRVRSPDSKFQRRTRSRSRSGNNRKEFCWYHRNFKEKALKCIPPCLFSKN